jgi:hypothetical protein
MIALASGVRVYLACGVTDMRKGMTGLAMLVQQALAEDPFGGAVFAFRGRRVVEGGSWKAGRADQVAVARWCRAVHADQAVGARPIYLAVRQHDGPHRADPGAIGFVAGWLRVAGSGAPPQA